MGTVTYLAVVFDLAGVLLDSEAAHENSARQAADRCSLVVPEGSWQRIRGGAYESFFEHVLALPENARRPVRLMHVVREAYDIYHEEVGRSARLFADAIEALSAARAMFPLVAVATSSEWRLTDAAIRHFDLGRYFDAVVTGDQITQKKPAPEAYLVTAWLLGIKPSSMVVVEDSAHGIRAARLARSHVVGIATNSDPQALRDAAAHRVVGDHCELVAYFRELAGAGRIDRRAA